MTHALLLPGPVERRKKQSLPPISRQLSCSLSDVDRSIAPFHLSRSRWCNASQRSQAKRRQERRPIHQSNKKHAINRCNSRSPSLACLSSQVRWFLLPREDNEREEGGKFQSNSFSSSSVPVPVAGAGPWLVVFPPLRDSQVPGLWPQLPGFLACPEDPAGMEPFSIPLFCSSSSSVRVDSKLVWLSLLVFVSFGLGRTEVCLFSCGRRSSNKAPVLAQYCFSVLCLYRKSASDMRTKICLLSKHRDLDAYLYL